jgi:uncharacterized protein YggE
MKLALTLASTLILANLAQAGITVSGTGRVKYTPDIAYLSLGLQTEDPTANGAWQKNAAAVKKVFDALRALGVLDKDLQTTGVNVSPKYHRPKDEEPRLVGYVATYKLSVTARKLGDIGKLLDAAVEAGANRSVGIRFACAKAEKLLDEARAAAVKEARKKAELYVTGAGAQLGLVRSVSEGTPNCYREQRFELAAPGKFAADSLPIAAGEQEMSVTVTLTYSIVHGSRSPLYELERSPAERLP